MKKLLSSCVSLSDIASSPDEEPDREFQQTKVSEKLLGMDRCQFFHRLKFHHDHFLDQEIDAKALIEVHAIEVKGHWLLSLNLQPPAL